MKRAFLTIGLAAVVSLTISGQDSGIKPAPVSGDAKRPATAVRAPTAVLAPSETAAQASSEPKLSSFNKASTLIGSAIKSAGGKPIGKVSDLVFDLERGALAYAVISVDAASGKARQVAVPVRALKPAEGHLVLNMSESVLAAAEGLQEGDWPGTDVFAIGGPAGAESGTASSKTDTPQN